MKPGLRWLVGGLGWIAGGWSLLAIAPSPGFSQIRPDSTLGGESSVVTPGVAASMGTIDQISGGAIRSNNLFHSFSEFGVYEGQRVYFANPTAIDNIISRVTGGTLSNINGTLGVLGNANLFLINPTGIIFGPNAVVDVRGSLTASTANQVVFDNGYAFSATSPGAPPLLTVTAPLGISGWLPTSGTLSTAGNLAVGGNLALSAANLLVQGQLQAGGDLSLLATQRLQATDSAIAPLILFAGETLFLQGNQGVEILALSHPDSGLGSGGEMILRSDGSVVGDAHFRAGGNFAVQQTDGSLGTLISPEDPVIEVAGDLAIANFVGSSLQILAGGSVTIPGIIFVDSPGDATSFNDSTVVLSNGTPLTISGTTEPTVDIRAGTTQFFGTPLAGTPTSADITIGDIITTGGLVFLTNQFAPNPALAGDINVGSLATLDFAGGGDVVLDSRGGIRFSLIDVSGQDPTTFDTGGNSGDVTLLARGTLFMPYPSAIYAYGLQGGNITLASDTAILQENTVFGTDTFDLSLIESLSFTGDGGDISLSAPVISLAGNLFTTTLGEGQAGDILIDTDLLTTSQTSIVSWTFGPGDTGDVTVSADTLNMDYSLIVTFVQPGATANGGDVTVQAGTITATTGAQIGSATFGLGNAGDVTVTAQDILLSGFQPGELNGDVYAPSSITSSVQPGAEGNGGTVSVTTGTLTIQNGADIGTSTFGVGDAGTITINASESVVIDGAVYVDFETLQLSQPSGISSEVFTGAVGEGGEITINTPVLSVTNGGTITTLSDGDGNAGNITINASESVVFDGAVSFASVGQDDRISGARVAALANSTGSGGTLTINTPNLSITNGARLEASTEGVGDAGNILLNVPGTLAIAGLGSGVFADTTPGSLGDGGSITVNAGIVTVQRGAEIAVDSQGQGTAGDIAIAANTLLLQDQALITAETVSSTGGNITLDIEGILALQGNSRISTTAGTAGAGGDGGNITIDAQFVTAVANENNDITANAFSGSGGNVLITAEGIFGLVPRSRAELEQLLGTSDPSLLDPANLSTNDITAISRQNPTLSGQVVIQSPDSDPSQGAIALPESVVDASRLIAQGCASGGVAAQEIGSLVATGRGGLPESPVDPLRGEWILVDWDNFGSSSLPTSVQSLPPLAPSPGPIQEVQALAKRADGQVVLLAQAPSAPERSPVPWNPALSCAGVPLSPSLSGQGG